MNPGIQIIDKFELVDDIAYIIIITPRMLDSSCTSKLWRKNLSYLHTLHFFEVDCQLMFTFPILFYLALHDLFQRVSTFFWCPIVTRTNLRTDKGDMVSTSCLFSVVVLLASA